MRGQEPEDDPAHDRDYYCCLHCTKGRHASCVVQCPTCDAKCLCWLNGHEMPQ